MSWDQLADELGTDPVLAQLDSAAIEAVVDVLAAVVYADGRASTMEVIELEAQLDRLPWLAEKKAAVHARVAAATEGRSDPAAAARRVAGALSDAGAREKVFAMAAALAAADFTVRSDERAVLESVGEGLGLDAATRARLIDAAG